MACPVFPTIDEKAETAAMQLSSKIAFEGVGRNMVTDTHVS
jgi:hypothetical protein